MAKWPIAVGLYTPTVTTLRCHRNKVSGDSLRLTPDCDHAAIKLLRASKIGALPFSERERDNRYEQNEVHFCIIGLCLLGSGSAVVVAQDTPQMNFFLTSNGPGNGADLGGLAGADAHCQMLAAEAGAGDRTWRAYLSTQGPNSVNARDRIGTGPWYNFRGVMVGENVDQLHSIDHGFAYERMLSEEGDLIANGAFTQNRHDTLTGSMVDGMAYPAGEDMTCNNWTSSSTEKPGSVIMTVRIGIRPTIARVAPRSSCGVLAATAYFIVSPASEGPFWP